MSPGRYVVSGQAATVEVEVRSRREAFDHPRTCARCGVAAGFMVAGKPVCRNHLAIAIVVAANQEVT